MKIVYENGDEVVLRRVEECSDIEDWGLTQDEYDALLKLQAEKVVFTVDCEATDDYYDISGYDEAGELHEFSAVSSYHFVPVMDCSLYMMLDL